MADSIDSELRNLPTDRRALLAGIGGLAAGTFLTADRVEAGLINPPSAPASTPGPEPRFAMNAIFSPGDETSVFKIKEPGSYYLVGNVVGQNGKHGIPIASSNVTIDLMGFAVVGRSRSLSGIAVEGLRDNLAVRNGLVGNTCCSNFIDNGDIEPINACLVVAGTLSGGVIGNSGGASPGSSNPNANYTY